ncbi:MAG: hypothetical protein H6810_07995 [Phycisphaeraceae bacterium]|nr:MAG: hypothetical protein H6810_07995 [Phycisphaeraceae bacterium]
MTKEEPNKIGHPVATRSIIARPWLVRIVVILTVLVGYGIWSLYDAYVAYPARGEAYASSREWEYLKWAIDADQTESPGILRREGVVSDPVGELANLTSPETQERLASELQSKFQKKRAQMELARSEWLTALSRIGHLHPAYTSFWVHPDPKVYDRVKALEAKGADQLGPAERTELENLHQKAGAQAPKERFAALDAQWSTQPEPGPLQSYDIPVNKISAAVCFVFSAYLIYLFVSVATRTYRWDPDEMRFTLPNGKSIVPADLVDVDKRKWDKFIVYLKIRDEHPTLGGKELRFDTYRHGHIESWILEMEKAAFPERVAEESKAGAESGAEEQAAAVDAGTENEPA